MSPEVTHEFQAENYRRYLLVLARTLVRGGGRAQSKIDTSDIVQEVLLKAHLALPQFKSTTDEEFAA